MARRRAAAVDAAPLTPTLAFDEATHTYTVDGRPIPSVTQVLNEEGFIDFSMVPNGTLERAQFRGRYVHAVIHLLLEGDFDLADCADEFRPYVDSALLYLATLKKRPLRNAEGRAIAVEWRFWHLTRMFAGTIDYLGWDEDDVLSIDDWKTGEPEDVAAALQTAAYEAGVRTCLLPTHLPTYDAPIRRRAVKLYRDGRPGRAEPYTDPRDLAMFYTALSCVHFRRNKLRHVGAPYGGPVAR
jgi:hypothetical protein